MNILNARSPAVQALLQLIRGIMADPGQRALHNFPETVNWNEVLEVAQTQGIISLLYRALRDVPENYVPAAFYETVRQRFHRNGLLVEMQKGTMFHVHQMFREAQIPVVFFKGPVLGAMAYGSPIWRKTGDIDILIRRSSYEEARAVMTSNGYLLDVSTAVEKELLDRGSELVFKRNGFEVDLHCSLEQTAFNRFPFWPGLNEQELWERSMKWCVDKTMVPCLSCEDTLYFLCAHGGKHAWTYLYMICDIALLIYHQKNLDWSRVIGLAEKLHSQRITYLGLYLARSVFNMEFPHWVDKTINRHATILSMAQKVYNQLFRSAPSFSSLQYHRIRAGLLRKKSERALYGVCLINRKAKKLSTSLLGG